MDKAIEKEQKKLAEKLKSLSVEEQEKKTYGLLCWLQGHEAGFEAGVKAQKERS